jgi:hypothetical protein
VRRRFNWKLAGWISAAALVIYLVIGVVLAGRDTPPIPPDDNLISLHGGHVRGNRITTRTWSFDYKQAQLSGDGTSGTIEGVRNGIIYKKGKPYLKISAERIAINTQSLDFTAVGKVRVELIGDPLHRSFDTDLVIWTNSLKVLSMDHPSYLHSGNHVMVIKNVRINFLTNEIHLGKIQGAYDQQ